MWNRALLIAAPILEETLSTSIAKRDKAEKDVYEKAAQSIASLFDLGYHSNNRI